MKLTPATVFVSTASVLVAAAVVAGVVVVGGPGGARIGKFDEAKLAALQRLAAAVDAEHAARGEVPETLDALSRTGDLRAQDLHDPATGAAYDYARTSAANYRLCTRFDRPSNADTPLRWRHGGGHVCFDLTARHSPAAPPRKAG